MPKTILTHKDIANILLDIDNILSRNSIDDINNFITDLQKDIKKIPRVSIRYTLKNQAENTRVSCIEKYGMDLYEKIKKEVLEDNILSGKSVADIKNYLNPIIKDLKKLQPSKFKNMALECLISTRDINIDNIKSNKLINSRMVLYKRADFKKFLVPVDEEFIKRLDLIKPNDLKDLLENSEFEKNLKNMNFVDFSDYLVRSKYVQG